MDWFIARDGKAVGPLTIEALAEAARRGELAREDCIWAPGAERWQRADAIASLWVVLPNRTWRLSRKWATRLQRAVLALIISGSALMVSLSILASVENEPPPPIKRICSLGDYLRAKCR